MKQGISSLASRLYFPAWTHASQRYLRESEISQAKVIVAVRCCLCGVIQELHYPCCTGNGGECSTGEVTQSMNCPSQYCQVFQRLPLLARCNTSGAEALLLSLTDTNHAYYCLIIRKDNMTCGKCNKQEMLQIFFAPIFWSYVGDSLRNNAIVGAKCPCVLCHE